MPLDLPVDEERFIAGVYNYCDGWCSACRLSSRCRVYAEIQADDAEDPPRSWSEQLVHWFERALNLVRKKSHEMGVDFAEVEADGALVEDTAPLVSFEHARLISRARAYQEAVFAWQKQRPAEPRTEGELSPAVPTDVIDYFAPVISSKVARAIRSVAQEQRYMFWHDDARKDSDGSAKVALLGAERSRLAWIDLRDSGLAGNDAVDGFAASLTWLIDELDRVFPRARRFVRIGFDE
jgi:hypothetical protein